MVGQLAHRAAAVAEGKLTAQDTRSAGTVAGRLVAFLMVALSACSSGKPREVSSLPLLPSEGGGRASYERVQRIFDQRCVVCHGCYDAPCQLLLSSYAGIDRGASKEVVYQTQRLTEAKPSRLFMDAANTPAWRERGFFSVTSDPSAGGAALMTRMLELGRAHGLDASAKLPDSFPLDINRTLSCARTDEFDAYAEEHPLGGMPYGMTRLSESELATLGAWLSAGAPAPPDPAPVPSAATAQVAAWEHFLNGDTLKQRIVARYLYEHLAFAHLYFTDLPAGPFFRVVRSSTPPGTAPKEIATRRPYDAPGEGPFWYRLRPIQETIVHKTHITYALSDARMRRLSALFLEPDWAPTRFPSYDADQASNPFVSFDQIPARSRYQFLLDDAQYFVMTFIRGPVCRGQVAVDVIEDQFFVAFLAPDHDPSVINPQYLEQAKAYLNLPAEHLSRLVPGEFWLQYGYEQRRYLDIRERFYDEMDPKGLGPSLDFIWDGDGQDSNALLTVFRHFDSATVVRGFVGAMPKTAWVIDFPIFERIYYNLVAGYDVFGAVTHQVATRLYMDHLRMQAENLFLAFLPANQREAIRESWYLGATDGFAFRHVDTIHSSKHGTQVPLTTADPKGELLGLILDRRRQVAGPPDLLNRCSAPPCDRSDASALERRAERVLQPLAGVTGPWVSLLPELALLRVRSADRNATDAVYSLVRNRAHTNVAFMFGEQERLVPADDTLTIVRGYLGSYPNFIFEVAEGEIADFARALAAMKDEPGRDALVERWGVRRTSPRFWATSDWIRDDFRRREPTEWGVLDLNRYGNL